MGVIDKAVEWIRAAAGDSGTGYDQTDRWGPDYDCSSLVITAFDRAGVPVRAKGATYTGNMKRAFLACGFSDVTGLVDRATGAGLKTGDVLLNEVNHTALVIAPGRIAEAASNELGGITGGQTGDQTGREVRENGYYNYPWDCVLRFEGEHGAPDADGTYTVQPGDTLWGIAERFLDGGERWGELAAWNGLSDTVIRPGMVLKLRGAEEETCPCLPLLRMGDTGEAVRSLQTLLTLRGFPCAADGEIGSETLDSLRAFAEKNGLGAAEETRSGLWKHLIG